MPDRFHFDRKHLPWYGLSAILLAAAALRLWHLGVPSLWGDEILFLNRCHPDRSIGDIVSFHLATFEVIGHLPLGAALFNAFFRFMGWFSSGGLSTAMVRMPAVLLGLVSLAGTALWVARQSPNGWRCGLWSAWILAWQFSHIWYAREARYYAALLAFGAGLLWAGFRLLEQPESGAPRGWGPRIAWLVMLAGLTFSHPSGLALAAALALHAGWLMARDRRFDRNRLWLCASVVVLGLLVWGLAGAGQPGAAHDADYRFGIGVILADLLVSLGFGPGLVRMTSTALLLVTGGVVLARASVASPSVRWAALPLVSCLLIVHWGGRTMPYHPRYFLLLLPFFAWFLAEAINTFTTRLPERWRGAVTVLLGLLIAAQTVPGLMGLYALNAKRDAPAQLVAAMNERLPPGTIALWDGSHALRFVPEFLDTRTPILFGAVRDASRAAYATGTLNADLEAIQHAFPSVSYLEWIGMRAYHDRRHLPPDQAPPQLTDRLLNQFGTALVVADPALEQLMASGWYPGSVPRLAPDRAARLEALADSARMILYHTVPPPPLVPVPDTADWKPLYTQDGILLLVGRDEALIHLPEIAPEGDWRIVLQLVTFSPGRLQIEYGGQLQEIPATQPGEIYPWNAAVIPGSSIQLRFTPPPGSPRSEHLALTGLRVVADEP